MDEILRRYDNLEQNLGVDLSGKCTAITLSNERCKIKAIRGSPFCGRHQPDEETEKAAREKAKKLNEADKKQQKEEKEKKGEKITRTRQHASYASSDYEIISPSYNFEDLGKDVDVQSDGGNPVNSNNSNNSRTNVTYYDQQYCRPIGDEPTLLIKSRTGSGKTKAIVEHLQKYSDKRCCYVVPIQALAKSIKKDLYDFHNYLDEKNHICHYEKVIISFFSLYKMERIPFDVLIIDESEELCGMIFSSIMMQQQNWRLLANAFAWHVQHASQVICSDAALSRRSLKLIEQIRGRAGNVNSSAPVVQTNHTISIYVNLNIPNPRKVIPIQYGKQIYIVSTITGIVTYHTTRYEQGLDREGPPPKFAFTSASAALAIFVYKAALSRNVKTIIHVADQRNHQYLEDVDKSWNETDLIIMSATVSVGIDCHVPMKAIFSYFSANMPVRTQFQMTMRFRDLRGPLILFENKRSSKAGITDANIVACGVALTLQESFLDKDDLEEAIRLARSRIQNGSNIRHQEAILDRCQELLETENNMTWLKKQGLYNKLEMTAVSNHYSDVMLAYEKLYNWQRTTPDGIFQLDDRSDEFYDVDRTFFKDIDTLMLPNNQEELDKIDPKDREIRLRKIKLYTELKKNGSIELDQLRELQKYEFMQLTKFGTQSPQNELALVRLYDEPYQRSKEFKRFLLNTFNNAAPDEKSEHIKQTFYSLGIQDPSQPNIKIRIERFKKFDEQWRIKTCRLFDIKLPQRKMDTKQGENQYNRRVISKIAKEYLNMKIIKEGKHHYMPIALDGRTCGFAELIGRKLVFCE